jgi:hypothetical protein
MPVNQVEVFSPVKITLPFNQEEFNLVSCVLPSGSPRISKQRNRLLQSRLKQLLRFLVAAGLPSPQTSRLFIKVVVGNDYQQQLYGLYVSFQEA